MTGTRMEYATTFSLDPDSRELLLRLSKILRLSQGQILRAFVYEDMLEHGLKLSDKMRSELIIFYRRQAELFYETRKDLFERLKKLKCAPEIIEQILKSLEMY